jgi:hypothetical protein
MTRASVLTTYFPALTLMGCAEAIVLCGSSNEDGVYLLDDSSNYVFDGSLDIATQDVAVQIASCVDNADNDDDGETDELDECIDLSIEWGEISQDLQGHEMDPVDDVNSVALIIFRYLSQEEVEQKLSENSLVQADVGLYVSIDPESETSAALSELNLLGNEIGPHQYLEEGYGTFMLYLQKGYTVGTGVMMSQFFEPRVDSSETTVRFSDESTILDFEVDLRSADPLVVQSGAEVFVDWSAVSTDGLGTEFDSNAVDQLMIARYEDLTLEDLEGQFLDIELLADEIWTMDLGGESTVDLSDATGDSGSFGGLDDSSTWLLALRCSTCANPAPLYLTVMNKCED